MLPSPSSGPTILLVANALDLASFLPVLESAKLGVMGAAGLPVARALLKQFKPDVLLTSLRLGEYNGFQLVMALREEHGPVPTFVVGEADPHTEAQAERAGAQLITATPAAANLAALIMRAFRSEAPRRWHRIRPDGPVAAEVRTGGGQAVRTASVIDIGVGGMGLKLGPELAEGLRDTVEVTLPAHGVTVPAEYAWHLEQDGDVRCGVAVPLTTPGSSGPWAKVIEHFRHAESRRRHEALRSAVEPPGEAHQKIPG
jgi:CheY-like chemotaxis protein